MRAHILSALGVLSLTALGFAQASAPSTEKAAQAETAFGNSMIREVSPGVFVLGGIKLEKEKRSLTFPATVNMDKGMLEYLIVGPNGPTHESLFLTEISAQDLHTLMLLLGAKGTPTKPGESLPGGQLNKEYLEHAPKLTGDEITITATYTAKKAAPEKTVEVSDWLLFNPTDKPPGKVPARGPWLYTGSLFGADGKFLASVEEIYACLVTNPAALINNPRKGNDDDRAWEVNEKEVPPAKTPVSITIKLAPAAAK